jgi:hypothetical protein
MLYAVVGEIGAGASYERWLVAVFTCPQAAEHHRALSQERAANTGVEIHYLTEVVVTSTDEPLS